MTLQDTDTSGELDDSPVDFDVLPPPAAEPASHGSAPLPHSPAGDTVVYIRPTSGWRAIDLRELWRYRELLFFLAWRDVAVRYKQTVLGAAWAVIQPVMTMVVFSIFFGKLGGMSKNVEIAYPIFVYAALVPWSFFSTAVSSGGNSLISNERLISKVYFPRLIIPSATICAGLVDFAISLTVLLVLMPVYKVVPTANLLLLPIPFLGMLAASIGMGTLLASLAVVYRDFRYVIPFLVQLWMFASPVAYPLEIIPAEWRLLYSLNPMAGVIGGYRACFLGTPMPWSSLSVSLLADLCLLLAGLAYFRRVERRFADIA